MKLARLACLALLVLCGCAYYNTFYSAKKAWDNAMEERRKNTLEGTSPVEIGYYQACIKSSLSLVSKYPKSKYVDDAVLMLGRCYLNKGDYDAALDRFHTLVDSLPKSELVPEALIGQAQTYAAMRRLAQCDREVLELVALDGLGALEAARALGISPVAARVRLTRARRRLRALLAEETSTASPGFADLTMA